MIHEYVLDRRQVAGLGLANQRYIYKERERKNNFSFKQRKITPELLNKETIIITPASSTTTTIVMITKKFKSSFAIRKNAYIKEKQYRA